MRFPFGRCSSRCRPARISIRSISPAMPSCHTSIPRPACMSHMLEPFFVKSLRRVIDQIRDEPLREEVDRFCRQEAQHYQRHTDFNKVVLAHGYPGLQERVALLKHDFDGYLANESDRFRIGYIEGFESYTTQLGLYMLAQRSVRPQAHRAFVRRPLQVAHARRGRAPQRGLRRLPAPLRRLLCTVRACAGSRSTTCSASSATAREIMSGVDVRRHGDRCRIRLKHSLVSRVTTTTMRARSMLPGYTPHRYRIPASIGALSAHFTQLAKHVR